MKKLLIALLIIAFITSTFLTHTASADIVDPIHDFQEIIGFPDDIKSGYTYYTSFTFSSIHVVPIFINFSIIHPDIEYDEWNAQFTLNGTVMSFNESGPGNFTSDPIVISKGSHILNLSFSSLANVVPGDYDYTFDLSSTPIEVTLASTRSGSSGRGVTSTWPITTPTAIATLTSTSTPLSTAIPDVSLSTVSPTLSPVNISATQTYITTDYRPHIMLGGMVFLLAAIIALILLGERKRKMKIIKAGSLKK